MHLLPPKPNAPIETDKLKKGDLVQLRSGGSLMTVGTQAPNLVISLVWHDERGVCQTLSCYREMLIRVR